MRLQRIKSNPIKTTRLPQGKQSDNNPRQSLFIVLRVHKKEVLFFGSLWRIYSEGNSQRSIVLATGFKYLVVVS